MQKSPWPGPGFDWRLVQGHFLFRAIAGRPAVAGAVAGTRWHSASAATWRDVMLNRRCGGRQRGGPATSSHKAGPSWAGPGHAQRTLSYPAWGSFWS